MTLAIIEQVSGEVEGRVRYLRPPNHLLWMRLSIQVKNECSAGILV